MKQTNKIKYLTIILILIILVVFSIFLINQYSNQEAEQLVSDNMVTRIIDGDTFELASGEIVRLICVDAPERGKERYEESTNFLSSLVLYKEVRLEKDIDDKDKYGRLLRYVYVNGTDEENENTEIFVNKEIIKDGYGKLFLYGNNTAKCEEIANEKRKK